MKKNLRNVLALALGLMTTVSFAQDWNVDSRTRIDMSGDGDEMSTDQRATVGATWGGSNWGIHVSSELNYTLGSESEGFHADVYEAYASTDLMGFASLTAGRQALDYGSGAIMSSNQWGVDRTTWDGMTFGLNLDMADVTFGYASQSGASFDSTGARNMWLNAAKGDGDWTANLLYTTTTVGSGDAMTAMGLDVTYNMMGGDLALDASYNTAKGWTGEDDEDMNSIGATYTVNENMSLNASRTAYGDGGFDMAGTNMAGGWLGGGNMGYLGANDEDMAIGVTYNMGDFTLSAAMHKIGNANNDDYERNVMDVSLGYTMSDNASLSYRMAQDNNGTDTDTKYNWITLTVTP